MLYQNIFSLPPLDGTHISPLILENPKKKKIKAIKRTDIEMAVSHNQLDVIHTYDIEEVVRGSVYGI